MKDWKPTPHPKAFHWCVCLRWLAAEPHDCPCGTTVPAEEIHMICLGCGWTGDRSEDYHAPCPDCGHSVVTEGGWAHQDASREVQA